MAYVGSTLDQPKTVLHPRGGTLVPCLDGVGRARLAKMTHSVLADDALRMIETAENILRDAGFYEVRVRHHQKRSIGAAAQTTFRSNYRRTE
jgi:hypothetical protein